MIRVFEKATAAPGAVFAKLILPFDFRQRSRFTATLENGESVAVSLPRGTQLRDGDLLRAETDALIEVQAALEAVSTAYAQTPTELARACFHLGNRHTRVQIGPAWVRYLQDHVLDEMVLGFGLAIVHEQSPFEPESGAYAAGHVAHHEH